MVNTFFWFMNFVERFPPGGYGTSGDAAGALNTLYPCVLLWRTPLSPNGLDVEQIYRCTMRVRTFTCWNSLFIAKRICRDCGIQLSDFDVS